MILSIPERILFHGFQMEPVASHPFRLFVFGQHAEKARGLALREQDALFFVAFGFAQDFLRFAAGPRQDVRLITLGLVDESFLVLAGTHHVVEGVPDRIRAGQRLVSLTSVMTRPDS